MKKITKALAGISAVCALVLGVAFAPIASVSAAPCSGTDCVGTGGIDEGSCAIKGGTWNGTTCTGGNTSMSSQLFGPDGTVTKIITIVVFIIGALCVGFLVFGGIQYILSAGDSAKVTKAKNTILYAIIGLIICIVAYAIVQFILKNIQ